MKIIKKTLFAVALAATVCATALAGCAADGRDGLDGRDGKDVSIIEIYNVYKEKTGEDISFKDFIREYLKYDSKELELMLGLRATVNQSLLSAVAVEAAFTTSSGTALGTARGSGVVVGIEREEEEISTVYVVTNSHVVYYAESSYNPYSNSYRTTSYYSDDVCVYAYGMEYPAYAMKATVVATCKNYDLALLKIDGSDLVTDDFTVAEWSTDEEVAVGSSVYTVGNAEGEGLSATFGYVSVDNEYIALDLEDTTYDESDDYTYRVMRTDLAINEGNSGGALFDTDGEIVGIINAKTTSADGMGYALPAATCRRVIANMMANDTGTTARGIKIADLGLETGIEASSRKYNEQEYVTDIYEVVTVYGVTDGGKADGSIEVGDIIKSMSVVSSDGTVKEQMTVDREHNYYDVMLSVTAGDTVRLTVKRNGEAEYLTYNFTFSAGEFTVVV